tara:strand:+ start:79 stop:504 length:426 start_codon:yes stop_codon:yes gene_type:complete
MTDKPSIKDIDPRRFIKNPGDLKRPEQKRFNDRSPQGQTKVYEDKIMKIAKSAKNKESLEEAKDQIEKFLKSIKGTIPAGLGRFAKNAILGVKKANKPGGIAKEINKDGRLFNKGGRVKKQVKKKPKVAGKLAKRGYGISR